MRQNRSSSSTVKLTFGLAHLPHASVEVGLGAELLASERPRLVERVAWGGIPKAIELADAAVLLVRVMRER